MNKFLYSAIAALTILPAVSAQAGDYYVSGSVGVLSQSDSDNEGRTGAFTTGNLGDGSTLNVASGTDYGWTTDFDTGSAFAVEIGKKKANGLRFGLEYVQTSADVDTHTNVTLGGGSIDAVDAAALAGSPTPLGVTVADVVADGQGEIKNQAVFLNAYYDFNKGAMLQPYLGAGIGFTEIDVNYRPSAIQIIDDRETEFAYQGKAGVTLNFDSPFELYGEAVYRASADADSGNILFPGNLDVENKQTSFSIGARYTFGG